MSGIVFIKTQKLDDLKAFYLNQVNCELWMDQGDCLIFKHGNFLFGFCDREEADTGGLITFFYDKKEDVDCYYEKLKSFAESPPITNKKYPIYHFFASDPESRKIEFQYFNNNVDSYFSGDELLSTRRSVRYFKQNDITKEILNKIFELSRFSPTSKNTQSYYFKVINEKDILDFLSKTRGESSAPIRRAPLSIAVCSNPELSKRHVQDGCIAAYHFILAAWDFGLGTCWIAAMDREDVKKILGIPQNHYIATITPLGYPKTIPNAPQRNDISYFIK